MPVRPPNDLELLLAPAPRLSILVALTGMAAAVRCSVELLQGEPAGSTSVPPAPLEWWGGESQVEMTAKGLDLTYWPRV